MEFCFYPSPIYVPINALLYFVSGPSSVKLHQRALLCTFDSKFLKFSSLQVDVLRNLRLPGVLIADPRLGGISTTLSALDSLTMQVSHQRPLL